MALAACLNHSSSGGTLHMSSMVSLSSSATLRGCASPPDQRQFMNQVGRVQSWPRLTVRKSKFFVSPRQLVLVSAADDDFRSTRRTKAAKQSAAAAGKGATSHVTATDVGEVATANGKMQASSVGTSDDAPLPAPAADLSYPGSPLMWIGVGVAFSVGFSWLSKRLQQAAMQQMFKAAMSSSSSSSSSGSMGPMGMGMGMGGGPFGMGGGGPFGAAAGAGAGTMPFPPPPFMGGGQGLASSSSSGGSNYQPQPTWRPPQQQQQQPSLNAAGGEAPSSSSSSSPSSSKGAAAASGAATATQAASTAAPATTIDATASSGPTTTTTPPAAKKKSAFADVSVEVVTEAEQAAQRATTQDTSSATRVFRDVEVMNDVVGSSGSGWSSPSSSDGGAGGYGSWGNSGQQQSGGAGGNSFSVDQLEKMLEDPMVQQMIYPYLPEEMRNPETFKWMMKSPEYRKQLEEMMRSMEGGSGWDPRMSDMFKNFDLNSQEVKQQFDQIGMTPQEVVSRIMSNPEVAMAFAKPNIQAAILDCSQNPLNIAKYSSDPEVMKVFTQISELFPGLRT